MEPVNTAERMRTGEPVVPRELDLDVRCAADIEVPVLVTATADTAEWVAHVVHFRSGRRDHPLIGYRVTGTETDAAALFQCLQDHMRDHPTVLVSDVSRLPRDAQVLLEGWLADQSSRSTPAVRLIATSPVWLHDMVERGEFNEDLYYRLNKIHIHVPSEARIEERPGGPNGKGRSRPGGCHDLSRHASEVGQ